jgi:hypothetical protein
MVKVSVAPTEPCVRGACLLPLAVVTGPAGLGMVVWGASRRVGDDDGGNRFRIVSYRIVSCSRTRVSRGRLFLLADVSVPAGSRLRADTTGSGAPVARDDEVGGLGGGLGDGLGAKNRDGFGG